MTTEADAGPLAPAAATVTVTGVLPLAGPAGRAPARGPRAPAPFKFRLGVEGPLLLPLPAPGTGSLSQSRPGMSRAWAWGSEASSWQTRQPTGGPELGFSFEFSSVLYCTPGGGTHPLSRNTPTVHTTRARGGFRVAAVGYNAAACQRQPATHWHSFKVHSFIHSFMVSSVMAMWQQLAHFLSSTEPFKPRF
jgi:hypothetical protein